MELFTVEYGSRLLEDNADLVDGALVITQPEVWDQAASRLPGIEPAGVVMAGDLSPAGLDRLAADTPPGRIVGIGGGTAMDTAKWVHWRRSLPLVQIPSLPSVNACFTRMTALRDEGLVRYDGDAVPEVVLVDYTLMRSAPLPMIRAGIGDVLSCHTALFDWRLAVRAGNDPSWDDEAAGASLRYVDSLRDVAPGLRDASDDGIRGLMELHREIGWRCHALGHARFEEGSEHFFAYCFEEVTGRTILHGELVSLGVLVMSSLQGNDPALPASIIEKAGTRHRLPELGITWHEMEATISRLPGFAVEGGYWDSWAQRMNGSEAGLVAEILGSTLDIS